MSNLIQLNCLDQHFADFITRLDNHPCDELWLAAALTSNATVNGHTCLQLDSTADCSVVPFSPVSRRLQPPDPTHWIQSLEACSTVGAPGTYVPMVLDRAGRLYLHRSWNYERQVAEGILARSHRLPIDGQRLEQGLDRHFPLIGPEPDLQREAARTALRQAFSVISGGPGTGKTATVARILALLAELSEDAPPQIALVAPTGKAALRLRQSILQAVEHLELSAAVKNLLPNEVSTIHRLLGVRARGNGFTHNRLNRLSCDTVIVDEASMVDLPLMAHLLEALRDDARLILLGDRDQLASVEAGAVLADICAGTGTGVEPAALQPDRDAGRKGVSVTQLTRSYRFGIDSGIGALSRLINNGDGPAAMELMTSGTYDDILWKTLPAGQDFDTALMAATRAGYGSYMACSTPEDALRELDRFRILSPLRSGPRGVAHLNRLCQAALGLRHQEGEAYCRLTPVMVSGNDYEARLFNGDTGVIMDHDDRPAAWFSDPDSGLRHLSLLRLPPHEPAFCLTVHKSQGSEFDRLLLILPDRISEVMSRELIYTAVTRARSGVEVWGTEEVFCTALGRHTIRHSGLQYALMGY